MMKFDTNTIPDKDAQKITSYILKVLNNHYKNVGV